MKPGRNDPCICGSGKKYKKCCGKLESSLPVQTWQQSTNAAMQSGSMKDTAPAQNEIGQLVALFNAGRHAELEHRTRLLLERYPDSGLAWKILGATLQIQGKDSLAALQKATELLPNSADAHNNLGLAFMEMDRLDEAEASLRRALEIKPDFAEAYSNLGIVLKNMARLDEAEASYRRALQTKPNSAEAHHNLGMTLQELDRMGEAQASFRQAIKIRPDYVEARYSIALAGKVKAGDENLTVLEAVGEAAQNGAAPLSDKDAVFLHFALGKSYDDIGAYEKAFPHFLEGGRLKRATFDYDPDWAVQLFDGIMRNFDAAMLDRLRGGGDPSRLPIFVLGMPRSGTTLTEQIIASHPEVHGAGELPDLTRIVRRNIDGAAFPDNMRSFDQVQLAAWGAEYVAGLQRRAPDASRITDKMPKNFHVVGLIHLLLPHAKIIHVKRNPVDTCLSCFTQLFMDEQEFTFDLAELGRYYAGYTRLMEHWRKVLPVGAFLEVQYEDIVAAQEVQSRRIIEYCGLEWDDACLDFHRNKRLVGTASLTQVRQPMYQSSVERWRHYEKFLGPLLDELGELVPDTKK